MQLLEMHIAITSFITALIYGRVNKARYAVTRTTLVRVSRTFPATISIKFLAISPPHGLEIPGGHRLTRYF